MSHHGGQVGVGNTPFSELRLALVLGLGVPGKLVLGAGGPRGCSEFWKPRTGRLKVDRRL